MSQASRERDRLRTIARWHTLHPHLRTNAPYNPNTEEQHAGFPVPTHEERDATRQWQAVQLDCLCSPWEPYDSRPPRLLMVGERPAGPYMGESLADSSTLASFSFPSFSSSPSLPCSLSI